MDSYCAWWLAEMIKEPMPNIMLVKTSILQSLKYKPEVYPVRKVVQKIIKIAQRQSMRR